MTRVNNDLQPPAHSAAADMDFLRLPHLADSAFPIGALAHSFGIESLASAGVLAPANLETFLRGYLEEAGVVEAVFCREAAPLARRSEMGVPAPGWHQLNH